MKTICQTWCALKDGCYEKQYKVPNIEDYNIKNVCKKFIDLAGM